LVPFFRAAAQMGTGLINLICSVQFGGFREGHANLPPHRRSVGQCVLAFGLGRHCGRAVWHVWGWRRLFDDAFVVLHRHPPRRRRGDRGEPDRGLVLLRRAGAFQEKDGGPANGLRPAGRRAGGRRVGGSAVRDAARDGASRPAGEALLRGFLGHYRRADVPRACGRSAAPRTRWRCRSARSTGWCMRCPSR